MWLECAVLVFCCIIALCHFQDCYTYQKGHIRAARRSERPTAGSQQSGTSDQSKVRNNCSVFSSYARFTSRPRDLTVLLVYPLHVRDAGCEPVTLRSVCYNPLLITWIKQNTLCMYNYMKSEVVITEHFVYISGC